MLTAKDLGLINDHVTAYGAPEVCSLDDETHIFHFDRAGEWDDSPILLVNKNGNHFRLIEDQTDGKWHVFKTWNGLQPSRDWERTGLSRLDPREAIKLAGVGPQGKATFEALCLLPRETTHRSRKAVWRNHMLSVRFDVDANRFTLINGVESQSFGGKMWESKEAAAWCRQQFPEGVESAAPMPNSHQVLAANVAAEAAFAAESHPLFGQF